MSNSGVRLLLRQISRQWIELDSPNTLHFYIRPFWMVGWQAFFQHSASCTPYLLRQQKRIHSGRRKLNGMETTYIQKTIRHTWTVLTRSFFWMVWNFFLRETIRTTYSTNAFISQMNNNDEIRLQILPIGKNIPRDTHPFTVSSSFHSQFFLPWILWFKCRFRNEILSPARFYKQSLSSVLGAI